MRMRVDRWLTTLGICSRSEGKDLIRRGRVLVNGFRVTDPGMEAETETDSLQVAGQPLPGLLQRQVA